MNPRKPKIKPQADSYYPFGLTMNGLSYQALSDDEKNKYLYNGKAKSRFFFGKLQEDFDLDWLDYGARFYDPQLGRWHTQDRFAEKYYNMSLYQYGGNDPIKNIDVNGDSLTANAWKWANKMIGHANKQTASNNKTISELDTKLKNGDIKQKAYDRKVNRLNESNTELYAAISEIGDLVSSNQWYDVHESTGLTDANGGSAAGITSFDFNTNMVVMTVDTKNYGLESMAHEFKHAHQFEKGDMDLGENGSPSKLTWDVFDEQNANKRSSFFGSTTITPPSGAAYKRTLAPYSNIQISKAYRNGVNLGTITRQKYAYRTNNQTKIWKP